jgi:hypothetical protein
MENNFSCCHCFKLNKDITIIYITNNKTAVKIYPTFKCFSCSQINNVCLKCKKSYNSYTVLKKHMFKCINTDCEFLNNYIKDTKIQKKRKIEDTILIDDISDDIGDNIGDIFIENNITEKKDEIINYYNYVNKNIYSKKIMDWSKFIATEEEKKIFEKINFCNDKTKFFKNFCDEEKNFIFINFFEFNLPEKCYDLNKKINNKIENNNKSIKKNFETFEDIKPILNSTYDVIDVCSFLFQNNYKNIYFEKESLNDNEKINENYQSLKQQLIGNEIILEGIFPIFFVFLF